MKYRAEIDGLRALAVLPVMFFHAGFELFAGGFVGVDVFFVVSGYLITTIIIEDIENKTFSFLNFYERRIRRILPALFFVILVCIPFAWIWMLPGQMKDFSQSLVAVSLFASNFLFWKESGYFDAAAEEKPLLHTWSLAVEEQYYVIFPIFLFFAWRFGKNKVFWITVLIAGISLMLSEWGWRNKNSANFFLAPTRVWEILAGSIVAFIVLKRGVQKNNFLSFLGLILIFFSIFSYDETTPFPSIYTLVPVVGVALLILYADKKTLASKILSMKLFVSLGLISYSAYLWHQPLFAFARIRMLNEPSHLFMMLLVVCSLILAFFSWRFIEKPFRDKKKYSNKKIFLLPIIPIMLFIIFGVIGHLNYGYEKRYPQDLVQALKKSNDRDQTSLKCFLRPKEDKKIPTHPISGCKSYFVNNSASVMMIGDSHLDTMSTYLQKELYKIGIGSYSVAYPGCPPFIGLYGIYEKSYHKCHEYNTSMLEYAKLNGIKDIIMIAAFPSYLNGRLYDNGEGGMIKGTNGAVDSIEEKKIYRFNDDQRILRVSDIFRDQLTTLSSDYRVIVFGQVPEVGWDVPKYYAYQSIYNDVKSTIHTHNFNNYKSRTSKFNKIFNSIDSNNLYFYSLSHLFCDEGTKKCIMNKGNDLLYRDDNHLSLIGTKIVARDFIEKFGPILLKKNN